MNKKELIDLVAGDTGLTKANVDSVLGAMEIRSTQALKAGNEVTLPGLGKLKIKNRAPRTGRNPRTGAKVEIPASTTVKFTLASSLKTAVQ